jgi:hypothetical protein
MWDHFCAVVGDGDGLTRLLDDASVAGWEMVSYSISNNGNLACFKRPRISPAEVPAPGPAPGSPPGG